MTHDTQLYLLTHSINHRQAYYYNNMMSADYVCITFILLIINNKTLRIYQHYWGFVPFKFHFQYTDLYIFNNIFFFELYNLDSKYYVCSFVESTTFS